MSGDAVSEKESFQTSVSLTETINDTSDFPPDIDGNAISLFMNISNFLDFEEYFELLIKSLHGKKLTVGETTIDFWKFYFKSGLYKTLEFHLSENDSSLLRLINKYFKILLIVVLVSYDASFSPSVLKSILSLLNQALVKLHRVILILYDYLLQFHSLGIDRLAKKDLISLLTSKLSMKTDNHLQEIDAIISDTASVIRRLLDKYEQTPFGIEIQIFWSNLKTISQEDINLFFQGEIIRKSFIDFKEASVVIQMQKRGSLGNEIELKPKKQSKLYTLVLDLDETLIHFTFEKSNEGTVHFRPYLFQFLERVSQQYEIVVFTAGVKDYADAILNIIERKLGKKVFEKRLYRQHTSFARGAYLKDLNIIGRDLDKVLIVDNLSENFQCQKENGIEIYPYIGIEQNDECLLNLGDILHRISDNKADDIKKQIKAYAQEIKEKVTKN